MPRPEGEWIAVRIWDLPIRLFHWAIVLLIISSWATIQLHWMELHKFSGYTILTLLLTRLVWGFIGSSTARFGFFLKGPKAIISYGKHVLSATPSHFIGHNPLGALSVVGLLLALWVQVVTGLLLSDTDFINSGPLSGLVDYETSFLADKLHKLSFTVLEILIALHIGVIFFYLARKRENLIMAMITGIKALPRALPAASLRFTPAWVALLILLVAGGFVYWVVTKAVSQVPG